MFVPYSRVRIETTRAAAEVRNALRASIDADVGFLPWLAPWTGRHLAGTVTESWFRLVSRSRSRNFFLPVTEGVVRTEESKTVVEATIRPKLTELLAFSGLLVLMSVLALGGGHQLWGVGAIGVIIYAMGCLGFAGARELVVQVLTSSTRETASHPE
jgi:hypothetical protein